MYKNDKKVSHKSHKPSNRSQVYNHYQQTATQVWSQGVAVIPCHSPLHQRAIPHLSPIHFCHQLFLLFLIIQRYPFVMFPFIVGLAAASCLTGSSPPPPAPPLPPGLSHVPPLPNGNSCSTIALVPNLMPARWGCLGTMSMNSDSLIQKTCFRAKNLGRVSSSRLTTSVGERK